MFSSISPLFLLPVPGEVLCTYCLIKHFNVFLYGCNKSSIWIMFWIFCQSPDKLVQRRSVILEQLTLCPGVDNLQRVILIMEYLHIIIELGHFKNIYSTLLYSHTGLCCVHSPCSWFFASEELLQHGWTKLDCYWIKWSCTESPQGKAHKKII